MECSGQLYSHQVHKPLNYLVHANQQDISAIYSADCTETRVVNESIVLIPSQIIAIIPKKEYISSSIKPWKIFKYSG